MNIERINPCLTNEAWRKTFMSLHAYRLPPNDSLPKLSKSQKCGRKPLVIRCAIPLPPKNLVTSSLGRPNSKAVSPAFTRATLLAWPAKLVGASDSSTNQAAAPLLVSFQCWVSSSSVHLRVGLPGCCYTLREVSLTGRLRGAKLLV